MASMIFGEYHNEKLHPVETIFKTILNTDILKCVAGWSPGPNYNQEPISATLTVGKKLRY